MTREEALQTLEIQRGFLSEQLDQQYHLLKEKYNYDILTNKYKETQNVLHKIEEAYYALSYSSNYIVSYRGKSNVPKEEMEEKIVKLIYDRIRKHKSVDSDFLSNLVEIMVCNRDLNNYVREIKFLSSPKEIAYYSASTKLLGLSYSAYDYHPYYWNLLNENEKQYFPYYDSVCNVAHEIEHVEQARLRDLQSNGIMSKIIIDTYEWRKEISSIWSKIFLISFTCKKELMQKRYDRYWVFDPSERLSNVYAKVIATDITEYFNQMLKMETILKENNQEFFTMILLGYDRKDSPTHYYYRKLKLQSKWKEIASLIPTLSFEDRLLLGVDITDEEYCDLLKKEDEIVRIFQKR